MACALSIHPNRMGSSYPSRDNPPLQNRTCDFHHIRLPLVLSLYMGCVGWVTPFRLMMQVPCIVSCSFVLSLLSGNDVSAGLRRVRAGESTCNVPITLFTNDLALPWALYFLLTRSRSSFNHIYLPTMALTLSSRLIAGDHYLALTLHLKDVGR